MASSTDNKATLDTAFAAYVAGIERNLVVSLHWAAVELVHHALANREFTGFTGNTQTSYTCGVFLNGRLVDVVNSEQDKPVRRKLKKDETVFLQHPYEGRQRIRVGYVKVDSRYGSETAMKFINEYRAPKEGLALVMTTGTEYSEFLETAFGLDVLTNTYKEARSVLSKNWRKVRNIQI